MYRTRRSARASLNNNESSDNGASTISPSAAGPPATAVPAVSTRRSRGGAASTNNVVASSSSSTLGDAGGSTEARAAEQQGAVDGTTSTANSTVGAAQPSTTATRSSNRARRGSCSSSSSTTTTTAQKLRRSERGANTTTLLSPTGDASRNAGPSTNTTRMTTSGANVSMSDSPAHANESTTTTNKMNDNNNANVADDEDGTFQQVETKSSTGTVSKVHQEESTGEENPEAELKKEAGGSVPSVKSTTSSLAILEIEKSIARADLFKVKDKRRRSKAEQVEEEGEDADDESLPLPPVIFVDGKTGLPIPSSADSSGSAGETTSASGAKDNSGNDSNSETEPESPKQSSTYILTVADDGVIYYNPNAPDVPVGEEGEVIPVNLPTHKIKSPSNPLPGPPLTTTSGRSRKTKPQAVTYGGESDVGFVDQTGKPVHKDNLIGPFITMEVGQFSGQSSKMGRQGTAVLTLGNIPSLPQHHHHQGPSSAVSSTTTANSTIVSLEVPTTAIDVSEFESHLDPQSIAVLENVLQSDQGREILTEALGEMGVVPQGQEQQSLWDHSYSTGGSLNKDESHNLISSSSAPLDSSPVQSSNSAIHKGPGRPPGRPSSGGSPASPRGGRVERGRISESESANIRRSQRQQDRIERQEAERIREENQQIFQREKEMLAKAMAASVASSQSPSSPQVVVSPAPPIMQQQPLPPVNVGIVSSSQSPSVDSTDEANGRRPKRERKLPAHLADPNYLSMEDASTAVKEATRRSSTQQDTPLLQDEAASPPPNEELGEMAKEEVKEAPAEEEDEDMEEEYTEDDPDRLWCLCQQPHNNRFMICCDKCEEWFHGSCVGVSKAQGKAMELKNVSWHCPNCKKLLAAEKKAHNHTPSPRLSKKLLKQEVKSAPSTPVPEKAKTTPGPVSSKGRKSESEQVVATVPSRTTPSPVTTAVTTKGSTKSAKAAAAVAAQKAEVEAAAYAALSAEPPSKIAAAVKFANDNKRGRRKSEKDVYEFASSVTTGCMICKKPARAGSAYCSDLCVQKYAESVSGKSSSSPSQEQQVPASSPSSKSPGGTSTTPKLKRSQSKSESSSLPGKTSESIFNFHVIGSGTSISTEVVPAKPKELTASALLKAQKEKEKGTTTVPLTSPTLTSPPAFPAVPGASPNASTVTSSPVAVKKADNESGSSTKGGALEVRDRTDRTEQTSRHRTSSVSDAKSTKSSSSTNSSGSGRSRTESTSKSSKEKTLERRESQKDIKVDGPSSEKLHRENMRKSLKEILKNRMTGDVGGMSSSDRKKMETAGLSPDVLSVKIEEELVSCFSGASNFKCKNKYRSIYFNLKDEKNSLFKQILLGAVKPYDLVRMTAEQMASSELAQWRQQEQEKELEAIKRAELEKLAEAKKQELIDKGVEDAVQVAEESKPLDISDVIADAEGDAKKRSKHEKSSEHDKSSRDKEHRSRHHHHHSSSSSRHEKRELRSHHDKDRKDRDKSDKHKHEKKSTSSERHSSSSKSRHRSGDKDKKEKDKHHHRGSDRDRKERRSDRDSESSSSSSKVKHESKESSRRHTRSKDYSERDRSHKSSGESPKSTVDKKPDAETEKIQLDKPEAMDTSGADVGYDPSTPSSDEPASSCLPQPAVTTTSATTEGVKVKSPSTDTTTTSSSEESQSQSSATTASIAPASTRESSQEDVNKMSVDSEQEQPSSTIKTPDFTEDAVTVAKKDGEADQRLFQSTLQMPELGEFKAGFYNVSHNEPFKGAVFPDSPAPIVGRIGPQTVWDYIDKMKKTKEIITFRLTPATPADSKGYMTFFSYLSSRERLGVIGGLCHPLKDVYLIPLDKHQPVPRCLQPFQGPGLPQERAHCLLAVVTRHIVNEGGQKRKLSSTDAAQSGQKKKAKIESGRTLRSRSGSKPGAPGPSPSSSSASKGKTSSPPVLDLMETGKGDENEPYLPWDEDEEPEEQSQQPPSGPPTSTALQPPTLLPAVPQPQPAPAKVTVPQVPSASSKMSDTQKQLQEIEARIAKEKQGIDAILAGAKNIVGIPGLDGDFPESSAADDEGSKPEPAKDAVPVFLRPAAPPSSSLLSSLDPRSTRSSIFKNQPAPSPQAVTKTSSTIPGLDVTTPVQTILDVEENEVTVIEPPTITASDATKKKSVSSPEAVSPTSGAVEGETSQDSEEAYSPSAVHFSDEEENGDKQLASSSGGKSPEEVTIIVDQMEHQAVSAPAFRDIDDRVGVASGITPLEVPSSSPSKPAPLLVDLDDRQTEEIKIILSNLNTPVIPPLAPEKAGLPLNRRSGDGTMELGDDLVEPPPPGEDPVVPSLPPLRAVSPPQKKVFEDSPFEKSPVVVRSGPQSKMKININLKTNLFASSSSSVSESKESLVSPEKVVGFKDIDERLLPLPPTEPPALPMIPPPESISMPLPPVDFKSVPPPISAVMTQPPPSMVPIHLPPPPLAAQAPATTGSVVINLNVPPPPFLSIPPPSAGPPPATIRFPTINIAQAPPVAVPPTPPNFLARLPSAPRNPYPSSPTSSGQSPLSKFQGSPSSTERAERSGQEKDKEVEFRGESRSPFTGRRSGYANDRRRGHERPVERARRHRSRSRSPIRRSRSRSRSRERKARRRRHSRSRSRSPVRRAGRRNRSRSRSRSPTL